MNTLYRKFYLESYFESFSFSVHLFMAHFQKNLWKKLESVYFYLTLTINNSFIRKK